MTKKVRIFIFFCATFFGLHGMDLDVDGGNAWNALLLPVGTSLKSVKLKNLEIDCAFWEKWDVFEFNKEELRSLSIDACAFSETEDFAFLYGFAVSELSITNCQITDDKLMSLLGFIYPYTVLKINLSGNNLGRDVQLFEKALSNIPFIGAALDELNLSSNSVDSSITGKNYKSVKKITV